MNRTEKDMALRTTTRRNPLFTLLALAAFVATSGLVGAAEAYAAEPVKVMICYPGGPGSQEEAAPRLAKFFHRVEKLAGWEEGRVSARYLNTQDSCDLYLKSEQPDLAILSLGAFLALGDSLKAEPLMEVVPVGGEAQRYYVVVEKSPAKTLAELKGKKLTGDDLGDPAFLSRVVFQGKVDAKKDFELEPTRTTLRAIKQVHKGKADAVLLDNRTYSELKTLPFGDDLRAVYTSEPLPGWPLLALGDAKPGDRVDAKTRKDLVAAMAKACEGEGAKVCEPVRLGGFRALKGNLYDAVRKLYVGAGGK